MKKLYPWILLTALSLCTGLYAVEPPSSWDQPEGLLSSSLWDSMRNHFDIHFDRDRPVVQHYIRYWQQHPNTLYKILQQAAPYIQYVYQQTANRDLPAELALIPFVESHYQVFAYSKAGAVGIWQMMPGTATGQGLKINWWYDGRRDIQAASDAALNYLSYLYEFFNQDWLDAIAAYDAGEGTVYHAIQYNDNHQHSTDFWQLPLPEEARQYIPKLIAICAIIDNPDDYGIELPFVSRSDYLSAVDVHHQMSLSTAARLAGVSVATMRYLNPGFKRWATDPMGPHHFLIPIQHHDAFMIELKHLPKTAYNPWFHHVVHDGESLSVIARHYRTTTHLLKTVNHLTSDTIRSGDNLLVPGSMHLRQHHNPLDVESDLLTERYVPGPKRLVHIVKAAETLEKIAKRYALKVASIYYWNHLSNASIHPGQALVLWLRRHHYRSGVSIKVKSGQNLSTIAKRYHTTTKHLMRRNHLRNTTIRVGQQLWL